MKRPAFQFYPADWRSNANLRRCSAAARGIWMDVLCTLHDSDTYGVVRWPLIELANAVGAQIKLVRELVHKGVLKGCDQGECEPYIYVPRSGRREGPPVILIPSAPGPVWYSSRMVKDEHVRTIRGEHTRYGADNGEGEGETPKVAPKDSPKPPLSDGSSSASSPSEKGRTLEAKASKGADAPKLDLASDKPEWWPKRDRYGRVLGDVTDKLLFQVGKAVLGNDAGGLIARMKKTDPYKSDWRAAMELLLRSDEAAEPRPFFAGALKKAEMDEPLLPLHEVYPEAEYRA